MKKYIRTNGSVGEQMIESILLENEIPYYREYSISREEALNRISKK